MTQTIFSESAPTPYLPVFVVHAAKAPSSRNRVTVHLSVADYDKESRSFGPVVFDGRAEMAVRGNSSFYYDKKSYRLELQTAEGEDNKVSLLGMPADSDWVLYGCVTDASFIRTVLAHELWRQMAGYAVRWRFVEVFIVTPPPEKHTSQENPRSEGVPTGERVPRMQTPPAGTNSLMAPAINSLKLIAQLNKLLAVNAGTNVSSAAEHPLSGLLTNAYRGTYILLEKIKRGKERVNIKTIQPEDDQEPRLSGGYILSKDRLDSGERGLMTGQEIVMEYVEPKERDITPAQKKWMNQYLADFEQTLYGQSFRDPVSGYRNYIDIDSFVDFHWMVEMSRNGDGYWFSQYMHKDRNDTLRMGPLWDWDAAFGNTFFIRGEKTEGWRFERAADIDYAWYERLFEDPDFLQRYIDRWAGLRANVFATSNILALADRLAAQVKDAQARDAAHWHNSWAYKVRGSKRSFDEEISYLKLWLTARLAWIDSQEFPRPALTVSHLANGSVVLSFTNTVGRIFYSLDHTDPRAPGGSVNLQAIEYSKPLLVPANTTLTARTRSQYGLWSAPITWSAPSPGDRFAEDHVNDERKTDEN